MGEKLSTRVVDLASDLSLLPLTEVLKQIRSANLFVGVHGPGMIFSIFLSDSGLVLELAAANNRYKVCC